MSTLLERLQSDTKDAMKARDSGLVQNLRLFVNAIQVEAKSKLRDLDDVESVTVLQREKKKRIEAAEAFEAGGAPERAAEERAQAQILDRYLPEQLSEKELNELVRNAISEVGAEGPSAMGAVMKVLVPKIAGRADGKAVSGAVNAALRG
ncbi:MAG: hypothetical protein JWO69_1535 [Thermoleophilia bacterium]|jgi:uncharacterized protein YqeY|nr:hypothetical protein [Thermoleophilia bacterium]